MAATTLKEAVIQALNKAANAFYSPQTLSEAVQTQVLTNLGVIDALEELITENGGTVPTSLSENSVQTMSAAPVDPWGDLE